MNNKIEQKEKLEHNFLQDAMDDGQAKRTETPFITCTTELANIHT